MTPRLAALPIQAHGVRLWLFDLDAQAGLDASSLSVDEQARARRFVFEHDRRRYVAAHAALRAVLRQEVGLAPGEPFSVHAHGKPFISGQPALRFNLSHSAKWALIGISTEREVGVDIEVMRALPDAQEIGRSHFQASELDELHQRAGADALAHWLLCGWTRKEACLKAVGTGLSLSPLSFAAGLLPDPRRVRMPGNGASIELDLVSLDLATLSADYTGLVAAVAASTGRG